MNELRFKQVATCLLCGIILTIPVIFGGVHPVVRGVYGFIMLVFLGSWLLVNLNPKSITINFWQLVPFVILIFIALQSTPLPTEIVEQLSYARSDRMKMVNELTGVREQYFSISESGQIGVYRAIFFLGVLIFFFSIRKILAEDDSFLLLLVYCLVGVAIFQALYGLLQFVRPEVGILWLPIGSRAAHGTIIYKNQYASLLNLLCPVVVSLSSLYLIKQNSANKKSVLLSTKNRTLSGTKVQGPLLMLGAGLIVLAVLFSLSRGGIVSMAVTLLFLIILLPFSKRNRIIFFTVILTIVVAYGSLLGLETIFARFASIDGSGAHRVEIYKASLPILKDHWLTGAGVGSFVQLSSVYLKGFPSTILYDRVHNEYLEIMIELGLPVASLMFIWILSGMVMLFRKILYTTEKTDYQVIAIGSFLGLVSLLLHGWVDFGWRLPANMIYAATLLAICCSCVEKSTIQADPAEVVNE